MTNRETLCENNSILFKSTTCQALSGVQTKSAKHVFRTSIFSLVFIEKMPTCKSSHVLLILDLCPSRDLLSGEGLFEHWLNSVIAFANSHLLLNVKNALTVIGSHSESK